MKNKALTIETRIEDKDVKILQIGTDSLYKIYDFCKNDFTQILIDLNDIISIKEKSIYNYWGKRAIYRKILQIAEEYKLNYDDNSSHNYNFYISRINEEKFTLGNNMKIIKENINDYKDYINTLEKKYIIQIIIKLN